MTTLLALASPELCAAALRQPVPASAEDAVRVIGAGATAMGLDVVCTPWDQAAEAAAVRARLGAGPAGDDGRLEWADTVTRWLVATPDHRPVVGVVSGPVWLAVGAANDGSSDPQEALDEASDFVAARVRTLCELGVAQVVVIERGGAGATPEPGAAADAHTAIARLGRHFGVAVTLAALDDGVPAEDLGYERWVSPGAAASGLALVAASALGRVAQGGLGGVECVVTEYLHADVTPEAVREAAGSVRRG
jgi:hypothetical protein